MGIHRIKKPRRFAPDTMWPLVVTVLLAVTAVHAVVEIHVDSVAGRDTNGGTSASDAVATLQRAVSLVSASSFRSLGGAIVYVHAGTYTTLDTTTTTVSITSTLLPNTNALWPVVFARVPDEARPVVSGGARLPAQSFRIADATTDSAVWSRVDPAARGSLVVADLAGAGVGELGNLVRRGFSISPAVVQAELYCDDQRMTLGRWPNEGYSDPVPDTADLKNITLSGATQPAVAGLYIRNGTQDGMPWFYRDGLVDGM